MFWNTDLNWIVVATIRTQAANGSVIVTTMVRPA